MTIICKHCKKTFKSNWHLRRHLDRKLPCFAKKKDDKNEECKSNVSLASAKCKSPVPFASVFRGTEPTIGKNRETYVCKFCNKVYFHRQSKHKHTQKCVKRIEKLENLKKVKNVIEKLENLEKKNYKKEEKNDKKCKKNVKNEEKNDKKCKKIVKNDEKYNKKCKKKINSEELLNLEDIEILNNFIKKYQNNNTFFSTNTVNSNNTINTTNSTTNNININIRAFGNENLDSLSNKDKIDILNKSFLAYADSLNKVHFNIPENRNFYQPNKNKQYIKYYNGDEWIYENQDKFTDILSDKVIQRLELWFDKYKAKLKTSKRHIIKKMIEEYGEGKLYNNFNECTKKYLLTYSNNIKNYMDKEINKLYELN